MIELVASLIGISGALATASSIFLTLAMCTDGFKRDIEEYVRKSRFGLSWFQVALEFWICAFFNFFGRSYFGLRFFLVVPFYTFAVSVAFFCIWLLATQPLSQSVFSMSPIAKQMIKDYFLHGGLFVAILMDMVSILLTKKALRTGASYGYLSWRFFILMMASIILAYFILTVSVFIFRVIDTVRMYTLTVPYDPIPIVPYEIFPVALKQWINFINPPTIIHVTSKGWFTTYFMPEPILFYTAMSAQATLVFSYATFGIVALLMRSRKIFIGSIDIAFRKNFQLFVITTGVISGFLTILLCVIWAFLRVSGV